MTRHPGFSCGFNVQTTHDLRSADIGTPSLGGRVQAVGVSIASADRVPTNQGKTVTISFTTQTPLLLGSIAIINSNLFGVSGSLSITGQSPEGIFSAPTQPSSGVVQFTASATTATSFIVTVAGVTLGAPSATTTTTVFTSTDLPFSQSTEPLGGDPPFSLSFGTIRPFRIFRTLILHAIKPSLLIMQLFSSIIT
jgi:hypothetical protein